jgi:hypothetical protein
MGRVMTFVLILSLGQSAAVFAAGPLEVSAARAARRLAQANGQTSNHSGRNALLWTGAAVAGAGVALMLIGKERCETLSVGNVSGSIVQCTQSTGLTWLGLGVAGVGGSLMIVGANKSAQIRIQPTSVAYQLRF